MEPSEFDKAWIVTLWQPNGNILEYIAEKSPNETDRLELVRRARFLSFHADRPSQALDTAYGLEYLHGRRPSVCHGDIKPVRGPQ